MTVAVAPPRTRRRGWRGPRYEGEIPSLGFGVLEWMSNYLPSPRDETQDFTPTDEQAQQVLLWYALHPVTGEFIYRRWLQMRAKGWGKSPLVGTIMLAELGAAREPDSAPVLFAGWDSDGEPVGRPWGTGGHPPAWVQIAAVSEDQTQNTYSAIHQMLTAKNHAAAIALGIDDGLTRLFLHGRPGRLEPVTASAPSKEGTPITAVVLDETHLYLKRNGGVKLARAIRNNASKMKSRTIETANAPMLGEDSVAEQSLRAAQAGHPGILLDDKRPRLEPDPSWSDERLLEALNESYGDSYWIDRPRLLLDIRDPDTQWEDALRFFFNYPSAGASRAVDPQLWDLRAAPQDVAAGTVIGLGFDGSISRDATVLRACTLDGYSFLIGAWVRPYDAPDDWHVPRQDVHDKVAEAFATYRVGRFLADPPKWQSELETWQELYGEDAEGDDIVQALDTNQARKFAPAVDRWRTALAEGTHTHDDDPVTSAHVKAARLKKVRLADAEDDGRTLYVLIKGEDRRQIDGAVADVLAFEAAKTMLAPEPEPEPFVIGGSRW
jgi:hypothetical protein